MTSCGFEKVVGTTLAKPFKYFCKFLRKATGTLGRAKTRERWNTGGRGHSHRVGELGTRSYGLMDSIHFRTRQSETPETEPRWNCPSPVQELAVLPAHYMVLHPPARVSSATATPGDMKLEVDPGRHRKCVTRAGRARRSDPELGLA